MANDPTKFHDAYVGEVVNGLAREAALWQARFLAAQEEIKRLEAQLSPQPAEDYGIMESADAVRKRPDVAIVRSKP